MTLIDDYGGVLITGEQSSGANLIMGNIATGGNFGFFVEEADDNAFIDNHAIGNTSAGFHINDSQGHVLSGNVATGNGVGFRVLTGASLFRNRALESVGAGFVTRGRGQLVGNIAKRNGGPGFNLEGLGQANVNLNVAKANRGDGFSISAEGCANCPVRVTSNSAIGNVGIGFHVLPADSVGPPVTAMRWIRAVRNHGGDMADDADCLSTSWTANTFVTAHQACIPDHHQPRRVGGLGDSTAHLPLATIRPSISATTASSFNLPEIS
jgi:parallel beta-helix repeat protein